MTSHKIPPVKAPAKATTRIITGSLKGRVLQLPVSAEVRPTRNRILQSAFNILQSYTDWEGLRVLDVCCGSGAWGLEGLSRGAEHVVLLDTNPQTAKANVAALGVAANVSVVAADAAQYKPNAPFDVVLADPPYAAEALMTGILANAARWGKPGSLWVLETSAVINVAWPQGFTVLAHRNYGASALHVARWGNAFSK